MRILIYGTGKTATEIVERGLDGKVIGYIETIRTKDAYCGIPVYSPSEICKQTYDAINFRFIMEQQFILRKCCRLMGF